MLRAAAKKEMILEESPAACTTKNIYNLGEFPPSSLNDDMSGMTITLSGWWWASGIKKCQHCHVGSFIDETNIAYYSNIFVEQDPCLLAPHTKFVLLNLLWNICWYSKCVEYYIVVAIFFYRLGQNWLPFIYDKPNMM